MSHQIFSEEEYEETEIQQTLQESKMKELALKKATNLIELLNIELEVQRNASQENLRVLQQELKSKHQHEVRQLQQKIEQLQLQLKRRSQTSIDYDRTIRKTGLTRENSCKSAGNIRRRAASKKYTETLPVEQSETPTLPQIQVSLQLYQQQTSEFEVWRRELSEELEHLIKSQYDELEELINRIEESSEECRGLGSSRNTRRNMHYELSEIIRRQNTLINGLRSYAQQLEDLCKSFNFQLSSIFITKYHHKNDLPFIKMEDIIQTVENAIREKRAKNRSEMQALEIENQELKNILESLINIVKVEQKQKQSFQF